MDKVTAMIALQRGLRAVSFILLLKSVVGFSVMALALFGVVVPLLGYEAPRIAEGGAAAVGAIVGALLALRA